MPYGYSVNFNASSGFRNGRAGWSVSDHIHAKLYKNLSGFQTPISETQTHVYGCTVSIVFHMDEENRLSEVTFSAE
jgi:hypothetical protein